MERQEAVEQFLKFKNECLLSRDVAIQIYTYFKYSPDEKYYECLINNALVKVKHDKFWDDINTSIIKELYKKPKQQSDKDIPDEEATSTDYTKLRKECVVAKHKLNFERNIFNKKLKQISALEELNEQIINSLKKIKPVTIQTVKSNDKDSDDIGVVVLSDLHLNELINIASNKYDFKVASKRLKKLATTAINTLNVKKIVLLGLGDFLNSDRRQSEYFNMVTNRSKAVVLAFSLLSQFIIELANTFEVTVAMVSGNESRVVGEDFDTCEEIATYNYDFTLFNMLKIFLDKDYKNIKFIDGSFGEKVLNINGSNVLITHGVNIKADVEKSVAQTFGRYAHIGINLDYMFMGHFHSTRIGDTYSRCGSLCGGNSYSEGALNLTSRASQLIGVFHSDKSNSMTKIDLQNVDDIQGYDIIEELETYNAKSTDKKNKFLIHNI